ncbi:tyrosine-type recombinase/integrase [Tomitella gaofuii]|uniref:tyrosine-type recombinase/integrase n=1 Tax=Tomitella gaofuii TaxID=2760083 RepID=UPI0015FD1924|nr:site-specific integrase [Tomitella gaofuii]
MGWAEQLPSGKYRAVYRDADGRRRSAGTYHRKTDARRAANKTEDAERDTPTAADLHGITWGAWQRHWQASRSVAESTARTDNARIRDHLTPQWGDTKLKSITRTDVQTWVTRLKDSGMAAATVERCYMLLSASMKAAVGARAITTNPCQGVKRPQPAPQADRYLADDEYAAIRKPLDAEDKHAADLMLHTGLRLGEAVALHAQHVNLDALEVTVTWAYDPVAKLFKPPKDHQARPVPISARYAKALAPLVHDALQRDPPDLPYTKGRKPHTGLILAKPDGSPINTDTLRKHWQAAARTAYVGTGKHRRKVGAVRLHDLRHTYASRLLRAGIPIEEVSRILGHGSITTTMRYAHHGQSQWDKVREALN